MSQTSDPLGSRTHPETRFTRLGDVLRTVVWLLQTFETRLRRSRNWTAWGSDPGRYGCGQSGKLSDSQTVQHHGISYNDLFRVIIRVLNRSTSLLREFAEKAKRNSSIPVVIPKKRWSSGWKSKNCPEHSSSYESMSILCLVHRLRKKWQKLKMIRTISFQRIRKTSTTSFIWTTRHSTDSLPSILKHLF